ncbi:hypothetical protein PVAP13_9NG672600 [Panicum virgatum]|uniref:FAR1 domain-containing protein n=1 Tax=Panicum virgatum TaxID=38727 RepID=A0A8T0MZP8_PANVG|nr:hypothetical protein PVAP13_9NG672600 [Panicum virgatum]
MSGIDDSERVVQAQQMREVSCTNGGIDLNVGAGSELFDCNSGLLDEGIEDRHNESTSEVCNGREGCSSVCVDSVFNDGVSGIQPPDAQLTQSWEKRPRLGHIPDEQEETTENPTALEKALKGFVIRKHGLVVQPSVGMHFDSMAEAFEFYNLYSWEVGFGIRYDRSRRNSERTKTIQDIVCICSVRPAHSCYFVPLPNFFE